MDMRMALILGCEKVDSLVVDQVDSSVEKWDYVYMVVKLVGLMAFL